MNIRTVLGVCPIKKPRKAITIVRGATAELSFDMADKPFAYDDIRQLYFTLKQGKYICCYMLYTYLAPTEDTIVADGKVYYENVEPVRFGDCEVTADVVVEPSGSPKLKGYYEQVELEPNQPDMYYMADGHFNRVISEGGDSVTLSLEPNETKEFKPTYAQNAVRFEISALTRGESQRDELLVYPQSPIIVLDSLISEVR